MLPTQLQNVKVTATPRYELDFDYNAIGISQWANAFNPQHRIEFATISREFIDWCNSQNIKFVPKTVTFSKIVLEFFSEEDIMMVRLRWPVLAVYRC